MKTQIFENYTVFLNRSDKTVNGVDAEFASVYEAFEKERGNEACWNCSGCSGCSDCSDCSGKKESKKNAIKIPIVKNIHGKVLAAVSFPDAFKMCCWHSCNTTHCRGGWVISLAGLDGKKLEEQTSSEFAAMAIYSKSSTIKVSPVRFYESNEAAMADIKRCAELEAAN